MPFIGPDIPDIDNLGVGSRKFLLNVLELFDVASCNTAMVLLDLKVSFSGLEFVYRTFQVFHFTTQGHIFFKKVYIPKTTERHKRSSPVLKRFISKHIRCSIP